MTRPIGVVGDPIAHSLSPLIHNLWLEQAGIDARYEPMHVRDDQFSDHLARLAAHDAIGINVTLPHKLAALCAADFVSPAAELIGAANTLTWRNAAWHADNTDAPGFLAALEMAGVESLGEQTALVFGAGGSARAVVYALHKAGVRIHILNRTIKRAASLSAEITSGRAAHGDLDQSTEYLHTADIVINTTSIGHSGSRIELPAGGGRIFFDLSYGQPAAAQLAHARETGWRAYDGLGMLVAQAAESFNIWFDIVPDSNAALELCRRAVEERT